MKQAEEIIVCPMCRGPLRYAGNDMMECATIEYFSGCGWKGRISQCKQPRVKLDNGRIVEREEFEEMNSVGGICMATGKRINSESVK